MAKNKPVIEPATGAVWPSAIALARELRCSINTIYRHLSPDRTQLTVQGRRFEYAE